MTTETGGQVETAVKIKKSFADAEEALRLNLPEYESRPQQQALAAQIEQAFDERVHLIAEAGTGLGKSLSYLIPAIQSGKRIVISTATKALQDQIASKDLPFLQANLGEPFTWTVLKGRSNYLCLAQANDESNSKLPSLPKVKLAYLDGGEEFVGDQESFDFDIPTDEWRKLTTTADECPGKKNCAFGKQCFAEAAKARATNAQIIVVNHALLFTDLKVKEVTGGAAGMLPQYDAVVLDEAHQAQEYATGALGARFTEGSIKSLVTQVNNRLRREGDLLSAYGVDIDAVEDQGRTVLGAMTKLWEVLPSLFVKPGTSQARLRETDLAGKQDVQDAFIELTDALLAYQGVMEPRMTGEEIGPYVRLYRRAGSTAFRFRDIITEPWEDAVRWVEKEKSNFGTRLVIHTAPIHVGNHLRRMLFSKTPAILVSATMSVDGSFDYIASQLGIDEFRSFHAGTPFDYQKQALLYVPTHLPEPSKHTEEAWSNMMIAEMLKLTQASEGRALLLFTSNSKMKHAYETLADHLPFTCLMQGQAPNGKLAAEFKADVHSVLFATRSFFEGVDFQGESCSLVVIDKIPFAVPDEPIVQARSEAINKARNDKWASFNEYSVPAATLILKQAVGRLIRHKQDKGVMAILDPRLRSKGYGRKIINSLPPARFTEQAAEAVGFFA